VESRSILSGNVGKARRQAARKRELRAAGLVDDRRHVIEVPLVADAREAMLIDQRLLQLGRLRNSILGTLRGRADKLRADPGWLSAGRLPAATAAERSARTDAFRVPRERYASQTFGGMESASRRSTGPLPIRIT